jgi:hypothetical protein
MPSVLEKVRAAIVPPKEGGDPIVELQRLEARRVEIANSTDKLLAALASIPAKERATRGAFERACEADAVQQIEETLNAWLEVAPKAEFAQREFNAVKQLKIYGSTMTQFRSEFPNCKDVLLAACRVRQEEATERHRSVLAEETARLAPEGFSMDQIHDSLLVSRASSRVRQLHGIEKRILAEPIDTTWKTFARELLQ